MSLLRPGVIKQHITKLTRYHLEFHGIAVLFELNTFGFSMLYLEEKDCGNWCPLQTIPFNGRAMRNVEILAQHEKCMVTIII